jgi:hypothetical protein
MTKHNARRNVAPVFLPAMLGQATKRVIASAFLRGGNFHDQGMDAVVHLLVFDHLFGLSHPLSAEESPDLFAHTYSTLYHGAFSAWIRSWDIEYLTHYDRNGLSLCR